MSTATAARIGSLCSGYGGLDLAAEAVFGGRTIWHAENAAGPSKILAERWPGVPNYGDISAVAWHAPRVDVMTAGYPCQPFSTSGLRKGADDERHLWPIVAETVRRIRPGYVFLENVAGHRSLGFDTVIGDLAAMRYVGSWVSLRASDVGAPHGRERVFILARDADRVALSAPSPFGGRPETVDEPGTVERALGSDRVSVPEVAADSDERGLEIVGRELIREYDPDRCRGENEVWGIYEPAIRRWETLLRTAPEPTSIDEDGICRLSPRFSEWMMGLPDGWVTDVDGLTPAEQLTALGNGVVPQQAAEALRRLLPIAASLAGVA